MASEKHLSEYKEYLEKDSQQHREALEEELAVMLEEGKKIAIKTLVIGGSFALSFYLIKKLAGGTKDKKKVKAVKPQKVVINKNNSLMSSVKHVVFTEAAVLLMSLAKNKLQGFLKHDNPHGDEHPENP